MRDRTDTFRALASRAEQLYSSTTTTSSSLSSSSNTVIQQASVVSSQLAQTTALLEELAALAKDTGKFNQDNHRIEQLTSDIKSALQLNTRTLDQLEEYARRHRSGHTQNDEHALHVVNTLKSKVLDTTKSFSQVLQTRSQSLKLQSERRKQFSSGKSFATQHRQRPSKISVAAVVSNSCV
jgi:hypothetical protein